MTEYFLRNYSWKPKAFEIKCNIKYIILQETVDFVIKYITLTHKTHRLVNITADISLFCSSLINILYFKFSSTKFFFKNSILIQRVLVFDLLQIDARMVYSLIFIDTWRRISSDSLPPPFKYRGCLEADKFL